MVDLDQDRPVFSRFHFGELLTSAFLHHSDASQADTIIPNPYDSQSWDRFAYAQNAPTRYVDPTGHWYYDPGCDCMVDNDEPEYQYSGNLTLNRDLEGEYWERHPIGAGDQATPVQVGVEWLTGTGPRNHTFGKGDNFTKLLQQHEHIGNVRGDIAQQLAEGNIGPGYIGEADYSLAGIQGVPKYIRDYSTLVTGGVTGNLAVTYLGGYHLDYYVLGVDHKTSTAEVLFYVFNSSTLTSGTRPFVIGYTEFWKKEVTPIINSLVASGPMSEVTQEFWWLETISFGE